MAKKLSLIFLIITVLSLAFSLTSCDSVGENITNSLTKILPDKDSSPIAEAAHEITDWIGEQFSAFLSFDWAKSIWEWLDTTLGITDKLDQFREAIDLIKTGELQNMISGIGTILSCGVLLLILGLLAVAAIVVAIFIELCGEVLLIALSIVLIAVVLILAILGFVFVILPKF